MIAIPKDQVKLLNDNKTESSSLAEKIKLFQKLQALQDEIESHKPMTTIVGLDHLTQDDG